MQFESIVVTMLRIFMISLTFHCPHRFWRAAALQDVHWGGSGPAAHCPGQTILKVRTASGDKGQSSINKRNVMYCKVRVRWLWNYMSVVILKSRMLTTMKYM